MTGLPTASFAERMHATKRLRGAILVTGLATFIPVTILAAKGASGVDVFGWMGSLAVYGFVVSYGLVCFALPRYLRDHHGIVNTATPDHPRIAFGTMMFAIFFIANLYPVPEGAYGKLPYIDPAYWAGVIFCSSRFARAQRCPCKRNPERRLVLSNLVSSLFPDVCQNGRPEALSARRIRVR